MEEEEDAAENQDAEQRQQQSWEEIPSNMGKGTFGLIFSRVLIHSSLFLLPQKLTEEEGTQRYVAGEKRRRRRKRKIHH